MKHFQAWFQEQQEAQRKPWLILGKGPTFSKRHDYDLTEFNTLSLNHVVREQAVTVAHMIDFDVFTDCAEEIVRNARFVVMPWIPHVENKPGPRTLEQWVEETPALKALDDAGRLLWYNLTTGKVDYGDYPKVRARFFSAEAVLNLLANCNTQTIRSLGIDGGSQYSEEFSDLNGTTRLANGHLNFNRQFDEIAKILMNRRLNYAPLDIEAPVRVYVGSTEPQMLAVQVLEHSIRKHASLAVEVYPLFQSDIPIPMPKDKANQPRTPFSFQRFIIPQWAGFKGRAIYVDSDMQVFWDIRSLWTMPFNGAQVLTVGNPQDPRRRPQFSVMLLDCENLDWRIDDIVARMDRGELTYEQTVYEMQVADTIRADIPSSWNCLEYYQPENSALVHYTDMTIQPWLSRKNPIASLWVQGLLDAIDDGFVKEDTVAEHVAKGYVRPSLLYQVRHGIVDCKRLPRHAKMLDSGYVPPHLLGKKPSSPLKQVSRQTCKELAKLF